jgi:hypothetical protein
MNDDDQSKFNVIGISILIMILTVLLAGLCHLVL